MFGKVNVNGGLTGGCAHCVITTTFAKCGVVTARQGFAGAANAPLTGFHSNERSLGLAAVVRQFSRRNVTRFNDWDIGQFLFGFFLKIAL